MFYMNLNYNHHTLSVECGKEMAAINSFDEKYKPHEHVLGYLRSPSADGCKLRILYNSRGDTILFEGLLREFLETNPKNDMVFLMGKLIEILAEVRNQCHNGNVPIGWRIKLWGAIGQGPDSLLGPFRQISGLEVDGAFSFKLQKLVKSLTRNEPMEVLQVMLADLYSTPPIIVKPSEA